MNDTIRALPTMEQQIFHDMEMGMFIHWAPYVYNSKEDSRNLTPDLSLVTAENFNAEQYVQTAVDLGAKYIVFVAKHAGGFCLWQTDTTPYSVKHIKWKDGNGDLVKDLSDECRRRGIKLGLYLSPCDRYLGIAVGGRAENAEAQENYNRIYRQQLTELLTRYGEIFEIWFDGSNVVPVKDILDKYAPHIMVFQSDCSNIRWVGNEAGTARYPAWNGVSAAADKATATNIDGDPNGPEWKPLECDTTIRRGWFWTEDNESTLKPLDKLMDTYYLSVGHGAVLLLNANPDRDGRIPESDARRAKEFGDTIRRLYSSKLAYTCGMGYEYMLEFDKPAAVDHVILMEDISFGELIREFKVEGLSDGKWSQLANGISIGHKYIIQLPETKVDAVKLTVLNSADVPHIRDFSVYYTGFPFKNVSIDYEPDEYKKIFEWGYEMFYGVGTGHKKLVIDLTSMFRSEDDVGTYEIAVKDNIDTVKLLNASVAFDGVEIPDYIKITGDRTFKLNVPGVGCNVMLTVELMLTSDTSRGIVLMRKE